MRTALALAIAATLAACGDANPEPVRWVPVIETNSGYTHRLDREPSSLKSCMAYLTRYGEPEGLAASWCEQV